MTQIKQIFELTLDKSSLCQLYYLESTTFPAWNPNILQTSSQVRAARSGIIVRAGKRNLQSNYYWYFLAMFMND